MLIVVVLALLISVLQATLPSLECGDNRKRLLEFLTKLQWQSCAPGVLCAVWVWAQP